jgi:branched-chain amino acid transport system ATP-binding protein
MTATGALELRGLVAGYGGEPVLRGIDITLPAGGFGAVLGPNGVGKTTTLRSVMGVTSVSGGDVLLDGEPIGTLGTRHIIRRGVALSPEGRQVFPTLSVGDNLASGAIAGAGWRARTARRDQVFEYFPVLRDRLDQAAGTLSGGEQQMLAVGRALMSGPRLLLVDEASLGLAPVMVERLFELLARVNADGVTVLAVEQNVAICDFASAVWVLERGRVDFGGPIASIADRLERVVMSAYLGRDEGSVDE